MNSDVPHLLSIVRAHGNGTIDDMLRRRPLVEEQWRSILRVAGAHGMQPYLYQVVKERGEGVVPESVLDYLSRIYYRTVAANIVQVREVARVQEMLGDHGIPILAFKGAILAHDAYGSIGLRKSIDVDILIPEGSFAAVRALLIDAGYHPFTQIQKLSSFGRVVKRYISRQVPFRRTRPGVNLDVHLGIMPPGYSYRAAFGELLDRSRCIAVQGATVRTFSPEDLLLILSFHGVKNRWESLKYGCDVAQVIRAHSELNWDRVDILTGEMRVTRVLHLGLLVASEFFGSTLPPDLRRAIREDRGAGGAFKRVSDDLMRKRDRPLTYNERFRFNLAVQDTFMQRVRYCLYALTRRLSLESI